MKRLNILLILVFSISCTREIEKVIAPPPSVGSVVGVVSQKESDAKVIIRQAHAVDSTWIASDGTFRIDNLPIGNYDLVIKAENYGTYELRRVVIQTGGVTYVGEISLSDIPDLVASHYPEDRAEVVFDRRWSRLSISINFTEPMDRESVEAAFSINPPAEGVFNWGTYAQEPTPIYFWNDADYRTAESGKGTDVGATITTYSRVQSFTYRLARKDSWSDTTYTVSLSTAAKDSAGNALEFPLTFQFSTIQSASTQNVILTSPEHGDIFVDPMSNASLTITFPRRMDAASVESRLTMTPETDIIYVWPEMNVLNIYTGGPLQCETLYKIGIDESALDLDGHALGEDFSFSFETAPVEVESTSPQNGQIFVSRDAPISFRFNTYMILSSMQGAFSISPEIKGSFKRGWGRYNDDAKDAITFVPNENYQANTKYTITLNPKVTDLHGANLKDITTFAFVTEPE